MKINFKKLAPYLVAVGLFALITIIYFKPLFSDKVIFQSDILMHKGMSKEVIDFRKSTNQEPLWTNSMFGGMPAYQISTLYTGNWLSFFDSAIKLFLPHPSGCVFLYFLGFFIFLLCLDIDPWTSLIGALAFGFSSYFFIIIETGHNSKASAIGYLPPLLGGIIMIFKGRYWIGAAVTAFFTALEVNANHVQVTYYGFMVVLAIGGMYFFLALRNKTLGGFTKAVLLIVLASVIGVLPNAASLLCTYEYGKYSIRGKTELTIDANLQSNKNNVTSGLDKNYATRWSYGIGETFTFLIPDFKGGASDYIGNVSQNALKKVNPELRQQVAGGNSYFGDQPGTSGPVYLGAIIMFLFVIGLFIVKHELKIPILIVTVISIALSWGHNLMWFTSLFMDYFPGYNKFRAVTIILIVPATTIPLIAILALKELMDLGSLNRKIKVSLLKREMELKKILLISFVLVGGFCLTGYLLPDLTNSFHSTGEQTKLYNLASRQGFSESEAQQYAGDMITELEKARTVIYKSDAMRSFIFIALSGLFIYLFLKGSLKRNLLIAAMGIFLLSDLWPVALRYLNEKSFVSKAQFENQLSKTKADEEILADKSLDYRVLNLSTDPFNEAYTSYWHKSIGGYHGAKLKKFHEIMEFHLDDEIQEFQKGYYNSLVSDSSKTAFFTKLNVLNMLNTKYFIVPNGEERTNVMAVKNPEASGNAWFVKKLKVSHSADSEIVALRRMDIKNEAVIKEAPSDVKQDYTGAGQIILKTYKPNQLTYFSESSEDQFAVFSEIFYPKGWNAYVDGELKPYWCVNYLLRGMVIPKGKHQVVFKFEPEIYKLGNQISSAGFILLMIAIGFALSMHRKGTGAKNTEALQ